MGCGVVDEGQRGDHGKEAEEKDGQRGVEEVHPHGAVVFRNGICVMILDIYQFSRREILENGTLCFF